MHANEPADPPFRIILQGMGRMLLNVVLIVNADRDRYGLHAFSQPKPVEDLIHQRLGSYIPDATLWTLYAVYAVASLFAFTLCRREANSRPCHRYPGSGPCTQN